MSPLGCVSHTFLPRRKNSTRNGEDMQLEQVQCALFAAYDIRNAMSNAEKRQPTENDTYGQSLNQVIDFLESLEDEMTKGVQS